MGDSKSRETELNIVIDDIGGNCPVQAWGTFREFNFYFRARGTKWKMEFTRIIDKYHSWESWEYAEPYGTTQFEAGWMTEEEALGFIIKSAELYLGIHAA